jgi:hypothetical protein
MSTALTFRKGAYIPGTSYGYTTTGSSQQSSAMSATVSIVRVAVNQDTYIALGSDPTATANSAMMPAGSVEFFAVTEGDKVAFLEVTAAGRVTVTELS